MQRLTTREQFQSVLAGGTVARTTHFVLHRCASVDAGGSQVTAIGALVPKRWAKRAVTRNAIKRQIYSVSADFVATLPATPHVIRLRSGFDRSQFVSARSDLLKAAVRLELQQLFAVATHASGLTGMRPGAK